MLAMLDKWHFEHACVHFIYPHLSFIATISLVQQGAIVYIQTTVCSTDLRLRNFQMVRKRISRQSDSDFSFFLCINSTHHTHTTRYVFVVLICSMCTQRPGKSTCLVSLSVCLYFYIFIQFVQESGLARQLYKLASYTQKHCRWAHSRALDCYYIFFTYTYPSVFLAELSSHYKV